MDPEEYAKFEMANLPPVGAGNGADEGMDGIVVFKMHSLKTVRRGKMKITEAEKVGKLERRRGRLWSLTVRET